MSRRALLLGASGLVGGRCLAQLLATPEYSAITLAVRRPLAIDDRRADVRVMKLEDMAAELSLFDVDDVFCCLGTTLRKAGSREGFYHVDHDLCVLAADLAAKEGAERFLMVSAVNANARSPFFYARTKGEAEQGVRDAGVPSVHLFQPSFLLGERDESRPAEWLGIQTMRLARPVLHAGKSALTPVSADMLASAMVQVALHGPALGAHRYRYPDFVRWSRPPAA